MNSFLDLWIDNPHLASKIIDFAFYFVLAIIMSGAILFRWLKVRKKTKENSFYIVLMDLCNESIDNLRELKENIRKTFQK